MFDNHATHVRAATPNNVSNLKRYCAKNTLSIMKNMLTLKCANYGCIVNVLVDEAMEFCLSIGLPIAMIDPNNADKGIFRIMSNMFGHGKGSQKKL